MNIYQSCNFICRYSLCQNCGHNGYDQMIFPALATPEYQIYSGDKIQGGIGDNLASSPQLWSSTYLQNNRPLKLQIL